MEIINDLYVYFYILDAIYMDQREKEINLHVFIITSKNLLLSAKRYKQFYKYNFLGFIVSDYKNRDYRIENVLINIISLYLIFKIKCMF